MKRLISKTVANVKNRDFVEGVSSDWFLRHFTFIIVILAFSLGYISLRFDCLASQKQITELQEKLNIVRTDARSERALYMSATGESAMLKQVNELGLDLHLQEQPPYTLSLNP